MIPYETMFKNNVFTYTSKKSRLIILDEEMNKKISAEIMSKVDSATKQKMIYIQQKIELGLKMEDLITKVKLRKIITSSKKRNRP